MRSKAEAGTTCGAVVLAEVSHGGKVKVLRVDVAFDTGRVMNKDAVQVELEGGTLFGLNMAFNEGLRIKDGAIVEGNFDEYPPDPHGRRARDSSRFWRADGCRAV